MRDVFYEKQFLLLKYWTSLFQKRPLTRYEKFKQEDAARKRREIQAETPQQRKTRKQRDAARKSDARQAETTEQTQIRRDRDSAWHQASRAAENLEQRQERNASLAQGRRKKQLILQFGGISWTICIFHFHY